MTHFTPVSAAIGGSLIGLAASALLLFNGRIAGITGIGAGLFDPEARDRGWRLSFLGGLGVGGLVMSWLRPEAFGHPVLTSSSALFVAGVLTGAGARWANGCTSGHGLCGLSRGSTRSFVAVATFMATGMITVALVRHTGLAP